MSNAILVSINPLQSESEIEYIINDSGAKIVICLSDVAKTIFKIKNKTNIEHIICGSWSDYLPTGPEVDIPKDILKMPSIPEEANSRWLDVVNNIYETPPVKVSVNDRALIIYTSGSTGIPKGVIIGYKMMWESIFGSIYWFTRTPEEVNLSSVAVFHVTGLVHNIYAAHELGSTIVLMARWDPRVAAELIQKYGVTFWLNIPTVVADLLNIGDIEKYDFSSIRTVGGGGSPMPVAVAEGLKKFTGCDYVELYGYTESFSQGAAFGVPPHRVKFGCCGIPHFGADGLIIDPITCKIQPQGEPGEIIVNAPYMFEGYWEKSEETREAFIEIGGKKYFRSGDIGYMDEEGYFFYLDRIKRMVNRAGYKAWPARIENEMYNHPAIAEVCVIGTPAPRVGEEVKAIIVLKHEWKEKLEKKEITTEKLSKEIIDWSKQRMAKYEYPRIIEVVDNLPKSGSGKILWRKLAEEERKKK
jgi:acyl-CoA synthetase (AMP-forming)/AMP-acid ligase II